MNKFLLLAILTQFLLTSSSLSQQAQQEPRILLRKTAEKHQQGPL